MSLAPIELIRRFLQQVPAGFMKVRYYGFLSPSFSIKIEEVKGRIALAYGFAVGVQQQAGDEVPVVRTACCPHCGGKLRFFAPSCCRDPWAVARPRKESGRISMDGLAEPPRRPARCALDFKRSPQRS